MNTRPHAITVLCFGDSNTWGQRPDRQGRFAANVRWTGKLQAALGDAYYVIEEGLSSRTTDLEYSKPGRNGKTYFVPCLISHNPLDYVIIMLGTNDLKLDFKRDANAVAAALRGLVNEVRTYAMNTTSEPPKIILISPILIDDTAPNFPAFYTASYDHASALTSRQLASEIATVAEDEDCLFIDASTVARPGEDGVHMSESSHTALAQLIAEHFTRLS